MFLFILGILIINVESGALDQKGKGNLAGDDGKSCYRFPSSLAEDPDVVVGWTARWKNQCPEGLLLILAPVPFITCLTFFL